VFARSYRLCQSSQLVALVTMSFEGVCKLFNPLKGFGFITTPEGTDIFLHIAGVADGSVPQKGDALKFDLVESKMKPGQMQAENVSGGTGVPGEKGAGKGGPAPPPGPNQGSCKSFVPDKGFGFIIGADGADIFFHVRGMTDGSTPQAGDALSFDMEESKIKPGQMQASNIQGGTGWAPDKGKGKDGGKGGYGAAPAWGGADSWGGGKAGPYGGGKDSGKDSGKGGDGGKGKMMAMMSQMMSSWGGGGGGDSWGGDASWSAGGGKGGGKDSWGAAAGGGSSWGAADAGGKGGGGKGGGDASWGGGGGGGDASWGAAGGKGGGW